MKAKIKLNNSIVWHDRILPQLKEKYKVIENDDGTIVIICGAKKSFIYDYKKSTIQRVFNGEIIEREMRLPELIKRFIHNDL